MRPKYAHWILLLVLMAGWQIANAAANRYVTDRIVLDLYEHDTRTSPVLRSIATGTAMTLLETSDQLAKVKLKDGSVGWVDAAFITDEKPIQVLYTELLAKHKRLQAKAASQEQDNDDSNSGNLSALKRDAKNAAWLRTELGKTRDQLKALEADMKTAAQERDAAQAELATFKAQLTGTIIPAAAVTGNSESMHGNGATSAVFAFQDEPEPTAWYNFAPIPLVWVAGITLSMLLAGYFAGVVLLDRRIRKKHGGFRLY